MAVRTGSPLAVDAVTLTPLRTEILVQPETVKGKTAGSYFVDLLESNGITPRDKDILVASSKVTTSFEGGMFRLDSIVPGRKARILGRVFGKDPKKVQVILETGKVQLVLPMKRITALPALWKWLAASSANPEAMRRGFSGNNRYVFVVNAHAVFLDDAGIDYSNAPEGYVTVLPPDPCATAARIRSAIFDRFGVDVAVIITDTATTVGRIGSHDVAIGYSGIDPVTRQMFSDDLFGTPRSGGIDLLIDSIAGMAGLVMGQTTEMTPAAWVRGMNYLPETTSSAERGMSLVAYPRGTLWRMAVLAVLSTGVFKLVNGLTFQRWPKRTRS